MATSHRVHQRTWCMSQLLHSGWRPSLTHQSTRKVVEGIFLLVWQESGLSCLYRCLFLAFIVLLVLRSQPFPLCVSFCACMCVSARTPECCVISSTHVHPMQLVRNSLQTVLKIENWEIQGCKDSTYLLLQPHPLISRVLISMSTISGTLPS